MKLIGITMATVLGLSSIAQAKRPFSFEGNWVSGKMAEEFRTDIEISNCRFASCDFKFHQGDGLNFCAFEGKLEKLDEENGRIFIEVPRQPNTYCIIDLRSKSENRIRVKGQSCGMLCPQGAEIDGEYENQNTKGYYETGYNCHDERNTYAEAAICNSRILSLGHRESQKLQTEAQFNKEKIKEWEKGRNFCQTETQCIQQKYHDFIEALSKKISGKDFDLQTYYQQTQGRYGSPFESFITYEKMQKGMSPQAIRSYEALIGERVDRSNKENIFITYIPQNKKDEERGMFYIKGNDMWVGYIQKGRNGFEEIFLYAPKGKEISETPKIIQEWENRFQNINCKAGSYCSREFYPIINFTASM